MTPDAVRAYRALDHIIANPERHNQEVWIHVTQCGTAGCLAGWVSLLEGDNPWLQSEFSGQASSVWPADGRWPQSVDRRATDLLGIGLRDADMLFDPYNTIDDLIRLVAEIFGPRPEVAS